MKKKVRSYYGKGNGRLAYFIHRIDVKQYGRIGINQYSRNIILCFPQYIGINEPVDVNNFGRCNYIEFEVYENEIGDFGNNIILDFLR